MKDQEWTQKTIEEVMENSELSYTQVYKWGWDQKKKCNDNPNGASLLTIDEFGGYCKFTSSNERKITKVLDVDLNEKIRLLISDVESEEKGGSKNFKSDISPSKPEPADLKVNNENFTLPPNQKQIQIQNNMWSPPSQKIKRQRYNSDITNATLSAKTYLKRDIDPIIPSFLRDEIDRDYSLDNLRFVDAIGHDSFNNHSFELADKHVSFIHTPNSWKEFSNFDIIDQKYECVIV